MKEDELVKFGRESQLYAACAAYLQSTTFKRCNLTMYHQMVADDPVACLKKIGFE